MVILANLNSRESELTMGIWFRSISNGFYAIESTCRVGRSARSMLSKRSSPADRREVRLVSGFPGRSRSTVR